MAIFSPVDRVEVHLLADNVTDSLSTFPNYVENEWSYLWRNGMKRLSDRCICFAAHGLSGLITAYRGESRHTILFDTGPEEEVFARNVSRLGVDLGMIEGIILSHGRWDHAGGMLLALDLTREHNGGREVPFYGHPGMYAARAMKQPDGSCTPQAVGTVPPSMTYSAPVMVAARSEARKAIRFATSSGVEGRPIGIPPSDSMIIRLPPS